MKTSRYFVGLVVAFILSACSHKHAADDPVAQLKAQMAEPEKINDFDGAQKSQILDLTYDVQSTNSLIAPYAAVFKGRSLSMSDDKKITCVIKFTVYADYTDHKWTFTSATGTEITTDPTGSDEQPIGEGKIDDGKAVARDLGLYIKP